MVFEGQAPPFGILHIFDMEKTNGKMFQDFSQILENSTLPSSGGMVQHVVTAWLQAGHRRGSVVSVVVPSCSLGACVGFAVLFPQL